MAQNRLCYPDQANALFYMLGVGVGAGVQGAGEAEARSHRPCFIDNTEPQRGFATKLPPSRENSLLGFADIPVTPSFLFRVFFSRL